ncbi:DNA starvation/stationary phase protection protein [Priestia filamentosa]|uniref:Dps family protein n=1 Tax=Priestia filamentosa TaxID=1402861 RepID=UPI000588F303
MSNRLEKFLNQELANFNVLFVKLNQYHWYVKGESFFTLHEKFQEYYEELVEYIDEIAERNLIIGNAPIGTLKEYLEYTTLKEEIDKDLSGREMVKRLLVDFKTISGELKEGIELAGEAGDSVTEDLLIGFNTYFEKNIWILSSYLKK